MIDYDDGTEASAPQMAYDVSNFISYMNRRVGGKQSDRMFRLYAMMFGIALLYPLRYLKVKGYFRQLLSSKFTFLSWVDSQAKNCFFE